MFMPHCIRLACRAATKREQGQGLTVFRDNLPIRSWFDKLTMNGRPFEKLRANALESLDQIIGCPWSNTAVDFCNDLDKNNTGQVQLPGVCLGSSVR